MDANTQLIPILCSNCGKKLGEVSMKDGKVAIKCKCGTLNVKESKPPLKSNKDGNLEISKR